MYELKYVAITNECLDTLQNILFKFLVSRYLGVFLLGLLYIFFKNPAPPLPPYINNPLSPQVMSCWFTF